MFDAARSAGVIGAPRPKLSTEERKARRKDYNKVYRKRVQAEAKAWRQLQSEKPKGERRRKRQLPE